MAVVIVVVGVIVAWWFVGQENLAAPQEPSAGVSAATDRADTHSLVIKPKSKRNPERLPAPSGSPADHYALLARCQDVTADTQVELRNDIDALKLGLAHVDPALRSSYEQAISEKESAFSSNASCANGVHPISLNDVHDALLAAAQSGDVASQLAFARDPKIDPLHAITQIDDLRQWKELASRYVNAAAASGNPDGVLLLAEASDPYACQASNDPVCAGMFTHLVNEDAEQAFENYYLAILLAPDQTPVWVREELSALQTLLSENGVSQAKKIAEDRALALSHR